MTTPRRTDDDLPAFFAGLGAWAVGTGVPVETVRYGSHPDQLVELRRAEQPKGTVLVLHGGFWRPAHDRSSAVALATALALEGWTTANAEYRRGGPGNWRATLDDVRAAAEATGADCVIGHSAGGHLALWLAAQAPLRVAVALGGVCDLTAGAAARLGAGAVQAFLGGEPDEEPQAYAETDPGRLLPLGTRQVLVHGTEDDQVPIAHARAWLERARAASDDCRLVELEGVDHYDVVDPRAACFADVLSALEE